MRLELLEEAVAWAKENKFIFHKSAWYGNYCDPIRALLLKYDKGSLHPSSYLQESSLILGVTVEWTRAFLYGWGHNRPDSFIRTPNDAYLLGWNMSKQLLSLNENVPKYEDQLDPIELNELERKNDK